MEVTFSTCLGPVPNPTIFQGCWHDNLGKWFYQAFLGSRKSSLASLCAERVTVFIKSYIQQSGVQLLSKTCTYDLSLSTPVHIAEYIF